jgi:hypothetical protein
LVLATLALSACDPHIFTITNGTDRTVTARLIYEERTQDRGMQELRPGEGRTVGAWEFNESRYARVEAWDADGQMIYCHRFARPGAGEVPDRVIITEGEIACEPFHPVVRPTPRPTKP